MFLYLHKPQLAVKKHKKNLKFVLNTRIKTKQIFQRSPVGHEVDSDTSLNDYIRNHLNKRGTKYMCKEGGCGACIVAVTVADPHHRMFSVNSVSSVFLIRIIILF